MAHRARHFPACCAILLILVTPARADFDTGRAAYQRGDYAAAFREWKPLAEQGDARAQFSLGMAYDTGEGVQQDAQEAVRWHRLAAEQGMPAAQGVLGHMYYYGRGVPKDYQEAARWYRLAAEQGLDDAQFHLGKMYQAGRGVLQDYVLAHMWLNLAAAQGHEQSSDIRSKLVPKMSQAQIAEAQRLAREWKPKR
jgi:hypothetical protein